MIQNKEICKTTRPAISKKTNRIFFRNRSYKTATQNKNRNSHSNFEKNIDTIRFANFHVEKGDHNVVKTFFRKRILGIVD